jgi:6-phosphogluconolactonase
VLQELLAAARAAIEARGAYHLVLTGGRTPRRLYELLRDADADWSAWHIYYGDERCLPRADAERNSRMAEQAWLNHVPIPPAQVHPISAERGAEAAAASYAETLAGVDWFDTVLLGLGEDGHIASLFPGRDAGDAAAAPAVLPVFAAPKPPPERVTLSARRLSATRQLLFLVMGEGKRQAVRDWRAGVDIPARHVAPPAGADVYLEADLLA